MHMKIRPWELKVIYNAVYQSFSQDGTEKYCASFEEKNYISNKICHILSALCKHTTYKRKVREESSATCTREG